MVKKEAFGEFEKYTISNDGILVSVTTLGATLTDVCFKGKNRVLSYGSPEEYLARKSYLCAIIGRYANRIENAEFKLNGELLKVTPNENGNQLHGGPDAFDRREWKAEILDDNAVKFELFSPDGDNGYPGNLTATVIYSIFKDGFRITFEAESDKDTLFAPTTHAYWQIDGSDVRDDVLTFDSEKYLPVDERLIPTGDELETADAFDFRSPKKVGGFFDHCFLLREGSDRKTVPALTLTGRDVTMELFTDFPAVQMYTGPIDGFDDYAGLALEPEVVPNSPNMPGYESPVLKKGEKYSKFVEYRFK